MVLLAIIINFYFHCDTTKINMTRMLILNYQNVIFRLIKKSFRLSDTFKVVVYKIHIDLKTIIARYGIHY
jgi:hypothetical protein